MQSYLVLAVFACLAVECFGATNPYLAKKPDFIQTCSLMADKTKQDKCTTEMGKKLFHQLIAGTPELQMPDLDPLTIPEINLASGDGSPVMLELILRNAVIRGLRRLEVVNLGVEQGDATKYTWQLRAAIPELEIKGNYTANGKILIVPIIGNGDAYVLAKQVDVNATAHLSTITQKDRQFFNLTDINVLFDLQDLVLNLDNLFAENKDLGKQTNEYLQANWREVKNALGPALSLTIGSIVEHFLGALLKKIPIEYILDNIKK